MMPERSCNPDRCVLLRWDLSERWMMPLLTQLQQRLGQRAHPAPPAVGRYILFSLDEWHVTANPDEGREEQTHARLGPQGTILLTIHS
jgi:hypothetical protein